MIPGEMINGLAIARGALLLEPRGLYDAAIVATTQAGAAVYCLDRLTEILIEEAPAQEDREVALCNAIDHLNYKILGSAANQIGPLRPHFKDPIDGEIF